jgi:hypothetical protein
MPRGFPGRATQVVAVWEETSRGSAEPHVGTASPLVFETLESRHCSERKRSLRMDVSGSFSEKAHERRRLEAVRRGHRVKTLKGKGQESIGPADV